MPKKETQSKITNFFKMDVGKSGDSTPPTPKRQKSAAAKKRDGRPLNRTSTNFTQIIWGCSALSKTGKPSNFKISSWNIVSLRALVAKKDGFRFVEIESPDVMCLQEVKCFSDNVPDLAKEYGYHRFFAQGAKESYAGVALYSKSKPLNVTYGLKVPELDVEGRIITAEFENFIIVNAYVPNSGRELKTLPKRLGWNPVFEKHIIELDKVKPVIVCGDLNVAHEAIDLKNPIRNIRSAGFTQEERDAMTQLLSKGFVDSFRQLNPDKEGAYTFWPYMGKARSKNNGWRLDYFLVSERLMDSVCDSVIRSDVYGSDHCPVTLFLSL